MAKMCYLSIRYNYHFDTTYAKAQNGMVSKALYTLQKVLVFK